MKKTLVVLLLVLMISPLGFADDQNAPLTKEQVIQMVKAGLTDDVIVARIKAQSGPINLSTDDLVALKSAGVSDAVIRALLAPGPKSNAAASSRAPASAPAVADPNDPAAPHDPGIYLMATVHDGGRKMILLERAGSGREKTGKCLGTRFFLWDIQGQDQGRGPRPSSHSASHGIETRVLHVFPS